MKTLYLHIGTRKTATSSIQKTIYNNRNIFKKNDLYYPKKWREAHNLELYCMFADNPENYSFNVFNNYTKEQIEENNLINKNNIIKEIKNTTCENILFSAEDTSALSKKNVENLKKFINIELNITNIKVIVGVRDVLSYLTSDLQQMIKDGMGKVSIQHYRDLYRDKIEKYIEVFGKENMIVYKFEDSIKHELGPIGYFCDIINFPKSVLSTIKIDKTNEGIPNKAIDLIEYINLRIPLINNSKLSHGRYKGDTQLLNNLSGDKFIPRQEFQEQVLDINRDDLEWLKSTFNIDYTTTKIKEMNDIEYDIVYIHELLDIYALLTPLIQRLVYDYLLEKKTISFGDSKRNLDTLIVHIQDHFPDVLNFELDSIPASLDSIEQNIVSRDTMINEIRDLAVRAERLDLKLAKKLMLVAHEERPEGVFIKNKLYEYTRKLEDATSALPIKHSNQKNITVNKIRDLAIQAEQISIELAKKLMKIAQQERPHGTLINEKVDEYNRKLDLTPEEVKLKKMLSSGEVVIIPVGFRCYTKMRMHEVLDISQKSLPFDSGFFPPSSVASIINNPNSNLRYPDDAETHTVCIKYENYQDIDFGKGIKFQKSTYHEINALATDKDLEDINKYLDSSYGYYTLDLQHNYVLSHYNWHKFANKSLSKGVYDPETNIKIINETLNRRIKRMFDMCHSAKYIFFVFEEHEQYKYMMIDDLKFDLFDLKDIELSVKDKFSARSFVVKFNEIDSASNIIKLLHND